MRSRFNAQALAALKRSLAEDFSDIRSVVVVRHGDLVFESYQRGSTRDTLHELRSVTKSVVSALFGVALQQGLLDDVDQPVIKLLPETAGGLDPRIEQLTLKHLLTLTAGFELESGVDKWLHRLRPGDPLQRAMRRPLVATPGQTFSYDNTTTSILSAVLTKLSNESAAKYAEKHLFGPLGIAAYDWAVDPSGLSPAHSGLRMRTSDMAKLGLLFLQEGAWDGQPIVQRAYALESTRRQTADGLAPHGWAYGYLWWVVPSSASRSAFVADGYGGQLVYVDPALDLVVAITSDTSSASNARLHGITLIRNHILRAVSQ